MSSVPGVGDVAPLVGPLRQADAAADGVRRAAGEHVRQLVHARAGEAGDAEDLAAVDVEVDAAQPAAADVARLEHDRRVGPRRHRRAVVRIDLLADHQAREPGGVDVGDGMGGDHAAAAQDGHAVGQLEDLVEAVRDVEHARARAPDLADHREQPLDLVVRQDRRRLVEHEHAAAALPALQRRGDRDHGPLDRRRGGQRAVDVEIDAEAREHAVGLALLLAPAHAAHRSASEAAVQREVVHRVELEHEAEVLVDEAQPVGRPPCPSSNGVAVELGHGCRGRACGSRRAS